MKTSFAALIAITAATGAAIANAEITIKNNNFETLKIPAIVFDDSKKATSNDADTFKVPPVIFRDGPAPTKAPPTITTEATNTPTTTNAATTVPPGSPSDSNNLRTGDTNTNTVPFKFGKTTLNGNGCPEGSVQIVPSNDQQTVSFLFSKYQAQTTATAARDRKSCNLAVPVDLTPGMQMGIVKFDYRGNVAVPNDKDNQAKFDVEYHFAGSKGPTVGETYPAGTNKKIEVTDEVGSVVWSPCGASTVFRVNTAITAQKPKASADSQVQVQLQSGSVDTNADHYFKYYIKTRKC